MITQAGRSCPIHYRYSPDVFVGSASFSAETLYVVGGVYGNRECLHRVFEMKRDEERLTGGHVELLFNGDFNWFDCDAESFVEINESVLQHHALRGNVETEFDGIDQGCGCNYPEHVDAAVVDRSNAIMRRLQESASAFPVIRRRVAALPMFCSVEVGGLKIGIVHGDADSLAGWDFAYDAMPALPDEPEAAEQRSSSGSIADIFRRARVAAFASTHTGLPFLQDFCVDGLRRLIINNGAAGMPNFKSSAFGLLTRISSCPTVPPESVYGTTLDGVRFDALPIRYDAVAWLKHFLSTWPAGSPAHDGYFERITHGPDFRIEQALRLARD